MSVVLINRTRVKEKRHPKVFFALWERSRTAKMMLRRSYRDEGNSCVNWLKEEDIPLSMPSEVNTVVRQKQRATENGFHCYLTWRLKINRAIYNL